MIEQWRLKNFKAVAEATLRLGRLSILSGNNSSGKSSVVQSMAVVAQTLASQIDHDTLVQNGHLAILGPFSRLTNPRAPAQDVSIAWTMSPQDSPTLGDLDPSTAATYDTRMSSGITTVSCSVTFGAAADRKKRAAVRNGSLEVETATGAKNKISWQSQLAPAGFTVQLDDEAMAHFRSRHPVGAPTGCELRHFLPSRIVLELDVHDEVARLQTQALTLSKRFYRMEKNELYNAQVPDPVLRLLQPFATTVLSGGPSRWTISGLVALLDKAVTPDRRAALGSLADDVYLALRAMHTGKRETRRTFLPASIPDGISYIESFFATKFRYLGPLREEPRATYPYPTRQDPIDLGRRGEYTASAYQLYLNTTVLHIPRAELEAHGPLADSQSSTLQDSVNDWLRYLEVADELRCEEQEYGHALMVRTQGIDFEMNHVGTGVSQVLPILVLGLLSQPDDFLVIEHPELHLHPKVQTRLADFFLFLAMTGRQVLVETHSEYVLSRIRSRIVQDRSGVLGAAVAIHFAERIDAETSIREVVINEFGAIEDWPTGFFDEGASEAETIVREALARQNGEEEE